MTYEESVGVRVLVGALIVAGVSAVMLLLWLSAPAASTPNPYAWPVPSGWTCGHEPDRCPEYQEFRDASLRRWAMSRAFAETSDNLDWRSYKRLDHEVTQALTAWKGASGVTFRHTQ